MRLDLDEVVVPGAGTSDDALETTQFTITYSVRVDDVAAIQNGVNLVNDADASADGLPDDVDNQASVTVVEPDLLVTKSIQGGVGDGTNLDAGDFVVYEIVVAHSGASTSDAFEVDLTDNFPARLDNLTLLSAEVDDGATQTDVSARFDLTANALTTTADIDLLRNTNGANHQTLTVVVRGEVVDTVAIGDTLDNTATVDYSSQDGDQPNERDDTASGDAPQLTVNGTFAVSKSAGATTTAVVGDVIEYTLTVELAEGTTRNISLSLIHI